MSYKTFRDLIAWQKAMDLTKLIYLQTTREKFPDYDLARQMRRAARSVMANIAEGQGRLTPAEFRRFLDISAGSLGELESDVLLSVQLNYLSAVDAEKLDTEIAQTRHIIFRLKSSIVISAREAVTAYDLLPDRELVAVAIPDSSNPPNPSNMSNRSSD